MSFPRSLTRLAAWLALLATVMLSVAPVISQHLQREGLLTPLTTSHAVEHHHAMMMPGMMADSDCAAVSSGDCGMPPDDNACGYCELLIHVPLLLWAFIPVLRLLLFCWRQTHARLMPSLYCALHAASWQPRGPPTV